MSVFIQFIIGNACYSLAECIRGLHAPREDPAPTHDSSNRKKSKGRQRSPPERRDRTERPRARPQRQRHDDNADEIAAHAENSLVNVVMENRRDACWYARDCDGQDARNDRMVYWVDGSRRMEEGWSGAAVVYREPDPSALYPWVLKAGPLGWTANAMDAELYAINMALKIATERREEPVADAMVFSDSRDALRGIQRFCSTLDSLPVEEIVSRVRALTRQGLNVEFRWVPGHAGLAGNEMADRMAKRMSRLSMIEAHYGRAEPTPAETERWACEESRTRDELT